jgi:hypothetical protein
MEGNSATVLEDQDPSATLLPAAGPFLEEPREVDLEDLMGIFGPPKPSPFAGIKFPSVSHHLLKTQNPSINQKEPVEQPAAVEESSSPSSPSQPETEVPAESGPHENMPAIVAPLADKAQEDVAKAAGKRKYLTDSIEGLSPQDLAKLDMARETGDSLRKLSTALVLEATLAPTHGQAVGSAGYQAIRDHVLRESGAPDDPVEEMLLEQFTLINFHIGQLHIRAAEAKSTEAVKVFYGALGRMQAEARKLALALQVYRSPPKQSQFTVVRQANIAAGNQQVAFLDQTNNPPGINSNHDTRLIPSEREAVPKNIESQVENVQPAARRGRPRKRPQA